MTKFLAEYYIKMKKIKAARVIYTNFYIKKNRNYYY